MKRGLRDEGGAESSEVLCAAGEEGGRGMKWGEGDDCTVESTHHSPLQSWRVWALVWRPFRSLPTANNRQTTGPTRGTGERESAGCTRMCMTQLCYCTIKT